MLDHISFSVNNYAQSLKFYDETFKIIGVERMMNFENEGHFIAGYGANGKPFFWIGSGAINADETVGNAKGLHIAFRARSLEEVNEWYHTCLKLGGKDNGAPGPRAEYHPGYYGAFIIDPNGWRIEVCVHDYDGHE